MRAAVLLLLLATAGVAGAQELDIAGGGGGPVRIEAADGIEWRRDERVYIARGDVRVERAGVVLRAETVAAHYRIDAAGANEVYRLDAEGNVAIRTEDATAKGREAVYLLDRALMLLRGGGLELVSADYRLTARDRLEYHRGERYAVARGAARVEQGERTLSAGVLVARFERAEGALRARRIEAFGEVEIATSNERLSGARAVYDVPAQQAEICGDVRIRRGVNRLRGECAQLDLARGRSRILAGGGRRVRGLFEPDAATLAPAK